ETPEPRLYTWETSHRTQSETIKIQEEYSGRRHKRNTMDKRKHSSREPGIEAEWPMNVLESACVRIRGQRVVERFRGKQPERGEVESVLRVPAFGPDFRDFHTKRRGKGTIDWMIQSKVKVLLKYKGILYLEEKKEEGKRDKASAPTRGGSVWRPLVAPVNAWGKAGRGTEIIKNMESMLRRYTMGNGPREWAKAKRF
ncbi:hypothetical protein EDB85DRAFT_2244314, partial [Lactarius pseudohatsudake]